MVEETIQTIKQAEKEAGEIAAQADARCEQILSQASGEAEKMQENVIRDAKTEAAAVMDSAGGSGKDEGGRRVRCHRPSDLRRF